MKGEVFGVLDAKNTDGAPRLILGVIPPFVYGLPWGIDEPWSDDAVLRIVSEDGSETHEFHKSDGDSVGDFFVFTFTKSRRNVKYRGVIVDGEDEFSLFDVVELRRIQDPTDPSNHLPLLEPPADDDAAGATSPSDPSTNDAADAPPPSAS